MGFGHSFDVLHARSSVMSMSDFHNVSPRRRINIEGFETTRLARTRIHKWCATGISPWLVHKPLW
jgi:hypothetical protein